MSPQGVAGRHPSVRSWIKQYMVWDKHIWHGICDFVKIGLLLDLMNYQVHHLYLDTLDHNLEEIFFYLFILMTSLFCPTQMGDYNMLLAVCDHCMKFVSQKQLIGSSELNWGGHLTRLETVKHYIFRNHCTRRAFSAYLEWKAPSQS